MSDKKLGVYKAIIAVQAALAKEGISKDRTCAQGASYKFRGIDDVFNALAPHLAANNLCILPRMISKECIERVSAAGKALFYTTVEAEFDFVSAEDGSMHTVKTFGEAMDSGDKSCNKSMSAAYKYAAFQAFCIPTEGDNDTENQTHEVKPKTQGPDIAAIVDEWEKEADKNDGTVDTLGEWYKKNADKIKALPLTARTKINAYVKQLKEAKAAPLSWECPRGGTVTSVECGKCDASKDCENYQSKPK